MNIIFCLSYLNVPNAISIIETGREEFKIATSNNSIEKLFEELYGKDAVWHIETPKLSKKHPVTSLFNIRKAKKRLLKRINNFKGHEVYAFFVSYCFFEAWVVKKLSKNNQVFYQPAVQLNIIKTANWAGWLRRYLIKIGYGFDTSFNFYGGIYRPVIGKKYLEAIGAKSINYKTNIDLAQSVISKKSSIEKNDILLLTGSIVEMRFVSKEDYCNQMDRLLSRLKEKGFTVSIKVHPRFNQLFSLEKELQQIPTYIPANLILDNFEFIIGYSTSTLFEAANHGKKSISLLKYFTAQDEDRAIDAIGYLSDNLNSDCKIHFPSNLSAILECLE